MVLEGPMEDKWLTDQRLHTSFRVKTLLHAIPGAALDKALVKEFGLTTIEAMHAH